MSLSRLMPPPGIAWRWTALLLCLTLAGCASDQKRERSEQAGALKPGDLEAAGIAFITPSTITGQEQEKQALAMIFTDILARERPKLPLVKLAETLGAINRAGLTDTYTKMYDDYRDTGLFRAEALKRIAGAAGTRYVGQLKLQKFSQFSKTRFNFLGFRFVETQVGDVRLFFQVWDSADGTIAWEGMQERTLSTEGIREKPILQHTIFEAATQDLINRLP